MLPSIRTEIRYYVTSGGYAPFADWFEDLDLVARTKITRAVARLERRNFSNVKSVGDGVLELRIDFWPGYRVYFGRDGEALVILLTGGTKKRQHAISIGRTLTGKTTSKADAVCTDRRRRNGKKQKLQRSGAAACQR